MTELPATIDSISQLDDLLSRPTPGVVETFRRLDGDVLILGAGGKMGPTLTLMAQRASELAGVRRRVIAVSRFSNGNLVGQFRERGVETLECDLLDSAARATLPQVPNVVFMTGLKFGSGDRAGLTWAMNCALPAAICEQFRHSRIAAFSTGNVYGSTPITWGGSRESDVLQPVGEYAMSCLGRERMFQHFSEAYGIPVSILRLNYATELRYGVLVDIAQGVLEGRPIDLTMGNLNALWQGDANAMALQSFDHAASPAFVVNLAGPELLSVRRIAQEFGRLFEREVSFTGLEAADALLNNGQLGHQLYGYPQVPAQQLILWIADWLRRGGATHGKPTHFEVRDGKF